MLEVLRMLGISILAALGFIGYIFLINFLIEAPKNLAQIAKSLETICERTNSDGPRR